MAGSDGPQLSGPSITQDGQPVAPDDAMAGLMPGSPGLVASTRHRIGQSIKPPIYRGVPYVKVLILLALILLYREWRTEGLKDEALFNDWLFYTSLVIGFYFVFGLSGQFA